jgi:hypothetical protein
MVQDPQRVLGDDIDRHVAVHRGRRDQVKVRVHRREHQGHRVVGPGVRVENQLHLGQRRSRVCHAGTWLLLSLVKGLRIQSATIRDAANGISSAIQSRMR